MPLEEQGVAKFLRDLLREDSAVAAIVGTRVYEALAPEGAALPYVLFQVMGGADVNSAGRTGARLFTRPLVQVKGVAQDSSFAAADALAAAIDAALAGANGSVVIGGHTYFVQSCWRETPVRYVEQKDGTRYAHVGGLYRLFIETTA